MSLVKCKECRKRISSQANPCPHCGVPREVSPPPTYKESVQNGVRALAKLVAALVAIVVLFGILSVYSDSVREEEKVALAAKRQRAAEAREAEKQRFLNEIPQHYERLCIAAEAHADEEVGRILHLFRSHDQLSYSEVQTIDREFRNRRALIRLEETQNPIDRLKLYEELLSLHPDNSDYAAAAEPLRVEVQRIQKRELEQRRIRQQRARREKLARKQFSAWDGSHTELIRVFKRSMHDPSSFEHVKTTYIDQKDFLLVRMKCRGRNGFGGLVLQTVEATVDLRGNVLGINSVE